MSDQTRKRLEALYFQAELDLINELSRLRSQGLVDYHVVAAMRRIHAAMRRLRIRTRTMAAQMVSGYFYAEHPELRRQLTESIEKHVAAYNAALEAAGQTAAPAYTNPLPLPNLPPPIPETSSNASTLNEVTPEVRSVAEALTDNCVGELDAATETAEHSIRAALEEYQVGRRDMDIFREVGLEQTALQETTGTGAYKNVDAFVERLRREGVTAFVDKSGRQWSLHSYAGMVLRTTSRQASNLSLLTDPDHDLYQISSHGTTCPICAPFEGRVYSKSGKDPDFPPLAAAFGRIDPNGPGTLDNTWLTIHPNCLHVLIKWTPAARTPEELQAIKDFSNPEKNPFDRDPRTEKQRERYRDEQRLRSRRNRAIKQYEDMKIVLPDVVPKTFATFWKHREAGDAAYQKWVDAYKEAVR